MKIFTGVLSSRLAKIPLLYPVWLSFLLMALAWVLPVQAGPSNDWVTYGWDVQRTGYNPSELNSALGPTSANKLHQLWASDLHGVINAQPVYAHNVNVNGTAIDILYIGTEDGVFHAVNASNGNQIWSRQLGSFTGCPDLPNSQFGITATAVLDRGGANAVPPYVDRVYVVDGLGNLYALDLATGATLTGWPVNILDKNTLHAYGALNLFVDDQHPNGIIYAVGASYCDRTPYQGRVLAVSNVRTSTPAKSSEFLPTKPPGVTGTHYGGGIWGIGGASIDPDPNNPNKVYVAVGNALPSPPEPENFGYAEHIVGLDLSLNVISSNYAPLSGSGDVDYGATPLLFNPSSTTGCSKSLLAAENKAGNMPVYDRSNLNAGPLQNFQIAPSGGGRFIGIPAFSPQTNYVYVSNPASLNNYKHGLLAFKVDSNCNLSLAWQSTVGNVGSGDDPYSPPTVANGVVYMADGRSGDFFAFDAAVGGPPLKTISNLGVAFAPPIVVDGRVYIGTYSHKLYSFGIEGVASGTTQYEAEQANKVLGGNAKVYNVATASGGQLVGSITGSTASFSKVTVIDGGSGGTATLRIGYANANSGTRQMKLYVNDILVQIVDFAQTASWSTIAETGDISINLNAGTGNSIKLEWYSQNNVDVDYYKVSIGGGTTVAVTGVSVSPTSASVGVNATTQLTASLTPSNATNKNVSWSSSNTGIATVDASGLVTGKAAGSATIMVTTTDGGFIATSAITVSGVVAPVTTKYEGEQANKVLGGNAKVYNVAPASGGKLVGSITGSTASFSKVTVIDGGSGGTATLRIGYANANSGTRQMKLYVNDILVQIVDFAKTASWSTIAETGDISINLNAGTGNSIKLEWYSQNNVDVDYYKVTK